MAKSSEQKSYTRALRNSSRLVAWRTDLRLLLPVLVLNFTFLFSTGKKWGLFCALFFIVLYVSDKQEKEWEPYILHEVCTMYCTEHDHLFSQICKPHDWELRLRLESETEGLLFANSAENSRQIQDTVYCTYMYVYREQGSGKSSQGWIDAMERELDAAIIHLVNHDKKNMILSVKYLCSYLHASSSRHSNFNNLFIWMASGDAHDFQALLRANLLFLEQTEKSAYFV